MRHSKSVEMCGKVVRWDGQVGTIRTTSGTEVEFLPLHLVANRFVGQLKVGDTVYFTCTVFDEPEYLLEKIRVVAVG